MIVLDIHFLHLDNEKFVCYYICCNGDSECQAAILFDDDKTIVTLYYNTEMKSCNKCLEHNAFQ